MLIEENSSNSTLVERKFLKFLFPNLSSPSGIMSNSESKYLGNRAIASKSVLLPIELIPATIFKFDSSISTFLSDLMLVIHIFYSR